MENQKGLSQQISSELPDDRLLSLMKEGGQMAFHQIYHKYWEGLYAYTHNILNDQGLTEDVLHEVFTNLWARREGVEINHLKSYLYNAVRNRALTKIREHKFTAFDEQVIQQLKLTPEIEQQFDRNDAMLVIEQAAEKLPARCKDIFYMNKFQHYSTAEIAQHYNISPRTVENQLSLALKHLRAELGTSLLLALWMATF